MQTPEERKKAIFWRVVRYSIMISAVIIITTVLFFLMLGYRLNRDNGTIMQGGLVQFISQPTGARVTVGNAKLQNLTRSKITLYPGDYLVKMEREGYDLWQKDVTVRPGTVLWLDSARLVPTNRQTSEVQKLSELDDTLVRAGGSHMVLLPDKRKAEFSLAPISDSQTTRLEQLTVPARLLGSKKDATHSYKLVEWSRDDRYFVAVHEYASQREFLRVDTNQPEKTTVVSAIGKTQPVEATFDPRSTTDLIVRYADGSVYVVSANGETKLLLKNVARMSMAKGSTLVYSTLPQKGVVTTGYLTLGKATPKELARYTTKSVVHIALGDYYYDDYLATAVGKNVTIEKIDSLPASDSTAELKKASVAQLALEDTPLEVSMRNKGRLATFAGASEMVVYDLELNTISQAVLQGDERLKEAPEWLDHQHFWADTNGSLRQYEYDGTNQADITSVAPGFSAVYTPSGKYLYSIGKSGDTYTVQRTLMVIE